jgi:hypothetical protein
MCPHTTASNYYICVLILQYQLCEACASPLYESSYYYMCHHTTIYVSSYYCMCPHTATCVIIPLHMCPHSTINVSAYYNTKCAMRGSVACPCSHRLQAARYVSSHTLMRLLYVCPNTEQPQQLLYTCTRKNTNSICVPTHPHTAPIYVHACLIKLLMLLILTGRGARQEC